MSQDAYLDPACMRCMRWRRPRSSPRGVGRLDELVQLAEREDLDALVADDRVAELVMDRLDVVGVAVAVGDLDGVRDRIVVAPERVVVIERVAVDCATADRYVADYGFADGGSIWPSGNTGA